MPARIKARKQRAIIIKMIMAILQRVSKAYSGTNNAGAEAGDIMIGMAIRMGQFENRPMTPNKVAQYIGMPRSTVIRKVKLMVDRGQLNQNSVTKVLTFPETLIETPEILKQTDEVVALVHHACAALSKLDT